VRTILDHWWLTGPWWEPATPLLVRAPDADRDPGEAVVIGPGAADLDDEQELWRVEASPGDGRGLVVVELCCSLATARWTLARRYD
jgi:hypothetical protein